MHLKVENVVQMPPVLEKGILYVSREYELAIHLCACGCGNKQVTPLVPETVGSGWTFNEDSVSLWPSLKNRICGAHYFVTQGAIGWCSDSPKIATDW